MTQLEVDRHEARLKPHREPVGSPDDFTGREAELHNQIELDIRARRWLYIHSRTDRATTTAKGVPDFVVFSGGGKVLFIEVKTKTGKLSPEQRAWQYCSEALDYQFHIVRSMADWLKIAAEK